MPSDDPDNLAALLRAVIEGQKRASATMQSVGEKYDHVQASLVRISRQNSTLDEALVGVRDSVRTLETQVGRGFQRMTERLDAFARRFDEIEAQADQEFQRMAEIQGEIFTQQNQIFDILNATVNRNASVDDLEQRVEAIEKRLGMG